MLIYGGAAEVVVDGVMAVVDGTDNLKIINIFLLFIPQFIFLSSQKIFAPVDEMVINVVLIEQQKVISSTVASNRKGKARKNHRIQALSM
ncbi:hypothetical protein MTR67_008891 [Solanum verrucosum]|uniref:Uncharacterized protein n=1 Tax=Solanum verrucosum TaxID=315347 RepID=A0AAF0Q7Q9_SOLVR|nr:hypothetical protein MTR67_008891 [Solanum verrucosum]